MPGDDEPWFGGSTHRVFEFLDLQPCGGVVSLIRTVSTRRFLSQLG